MGLKRPATLVCLLAAAGCRQAPNGVSPAPTVPAGTNSLSAVSIPVASPAAQTDSTSKGLPNPALTPGERDPKPNKRTSIDPSVQQKVLKAYGGPTDAERVVCRLIPPEIGGTSNEANLFVTTPWFSNLKARLDKKLVELVRSKAITAEQAEKDLKTNWIKATHKYYVRNYGEGDRAAAKKREDENRW